MFLSNRIASGRSPRHGNDASTTGLLRTGRDIDRLARLAAKAVQSSAAFVTLTDCGADEIVFAGITGIPEIPAGERMPLSNTICRHIVSSGVPLVAADTHTHPIARNEAALHALGFGAYLGVPLTTAEGEVIGVLCAVDRHAREWSPDQIEITEGLAAAVMTELGLRNAIERAARGRSGTRSRVRLFARLHRRHGPRGHR